MPQPGFSGEVNIQIFFGTKYDDINVPYYSSQIIDQATKELSLTGQVVWQSKMLSTIDINVFDYQDIVGAQYVGITDTGTSSNGLSWYIVLGYQQISKKTTRLSIRYDPLLSIVIGNIAGVSGTIKRWTVRQDTPWRYTKSPEPINQIADYQYSYFRHDCWSTATMFNLVGFPYDMTEQPEILNYTNSDGTQTNIYYPNMNTISGNGTSFRTSIGGQKTFWDGLQYYVMWQVPTVQRNYNYAMALGMDLVSNSYALPNSTLWSLAPGTASPLGSVQGNTENIPTGMTLYETGYNNQKAAEIGTFFSLYNEVTGDCVTVGAEDLSDTTLDLGCNPYINGCFAARFHSYMHDTAGFSGYVKSSGWQPALISSSLAAGSALSRINNAIQMDSVMVNTSNAEASVRTQASNAYNTYKTGQLTSAVTGLTGMVGNLLSLDIGGAVGNVVNTWSSLSNQTAQFENASDAADTALANIRASRSQQMAALSAQGTLGQIAPPSIKFNNSTNLEANSYAFAVRKTSLSQTDRQRADRFFTAYGYNVDNEILNDPAQFRARQRFTFIMADNVEITELTGVGTNLTRIRDNDTVKEIQERFSAGLRIWFAEPNFDYSIANPAYG